jgi:branched-chain amino acid transport system permease protein
VLGALVLLLVEEAARRVTGGMAGADMIVYSLVLMIVISVEPRGMLAILDRLRPPSRAQPAAHGEVP